MSGESSIIDISFSTQNLKSYIDIKHDLALNILKSDISHNRALLNGKIMKAKDINLNVLQSVFFNNSI